MNKPKIKVSSSVGQFREKAKKAWGLEEWDGIYDQSPHVLFFGLFHDRDFEVFHNFKGEKSVFWCGGDILRLIEDYERQRVMRLSPETKHYCETEQEADNLRSVGIEPEVIPSFLGNIANYPISFQPPLEGEKWKVWLDGHPNREVEYGWSHVRELAKMFPDVEFHLYGIEDEEVSTPFDGLLNVKNHGWVEEEKLDKEIKEYHCAFRANEKDGVSEIVIKGILLGQFVISRLPYEGVNQYTTFEELIELMKKMREQKEPNYATRSIWLKRLNQFPWCKQEFWNPEQQ